MKAPFLALGLLLLRAFAPDLAAAQGFVTVRDGRFYAEGAPFRFSGANASVMHGARERAALTTTLDAVVRDGGSVVRIWALGEAPAGSPEWRRDYAFRLGPDGFVDASFSHLDAVLDAAKARGLRVIVVLANRWHDYGGFPEYLRWAEPDVPFEANGNLPRALLGRFFASERARALYRAHVSRVVSRVHARTGVAYKDDPTIFAWELANETSAQAEEDEAALVAWTRAEAAFIKSLDPNHLVSAGHIGYDTLRERETWLRVQSLPEIDFADVHVYPLGDPRVRTPRHLAAYLDDRIALAHDVIRKPLVFGEFGFDGSRDELHGRARIAWTRDFLSHVSALGVAGALVWFYEPGSPSTRLHTIPATPDTEATPLREMLRTFAARFADDVPPRSFGGGDTPRFLERNVIRQDHVHTLTAAGLDFELAVSALEFSEAAFERADIYGGPPIPHLWGVGTGAVHYDFREPEGAPPARLSVKLFLSSELDGRGVGARATETSLVRVLLDDVELTTVVAPVDDGLGHPVSIVIDDRALLERVFRGPRRQHRLSLVASSRPNAGGLCVYGAVTAASKPSIANATERDTSFHMVWTRR